MQENSNEGPKGITRRGLLIGGAAAAAKVLLGCSPKKDELPAKVNSEGSYIGDKVEVKIVDNGRISSMEVSQYLNNKFSGGEFDILEPVGDDQQPQKTVESGMLIRNSFDHTTGEDEPGNNIAGKINTPNFQLPKVHQVVEVHRAGIRDTEKWAVFSYQELVKKAGENPDKNAISLIDPNKLQAVKNGQDKMVFICMEIRHPGEDQPTEKFIGPVK
jgi:hypothetical protein